MGGSVGGWVGGPGGRQMLFPTTIGAPEKYSPISKGKSKKQLQKCIKWKLQAINVEVTDNQISKMSFFYCEILKDI